MAPKGLTRDALIDWYCMFVPSSVSLAACIYMFLTYAMFKRIRTPAVNLVMLQTLAETFLCLSHNVAFYNPPETDTDLCRFQGWFINFSLLSSLMFTAAISGYMNATLSRNRREVELNARNLTILASVIFGFSGLCAALPLISDQYVDLGPRCWIAENEEGRDRNAGVAYRFATHYGVIWALNIYLFVCFYEVIKYLRENASQRAARGNNQQIERTIRILMYYPSKFARVSSPAICILFYLFMCQRFSYLLLCVDHSHRTPTHDGHSRGSIFASLGTGLCPRTADFPRHAVCHRIFSGVSFLGTCIFLVSTYVI
jgi:hypothetical protein